MIGTEKLKPKEKINGGSTQKALKLVKKSFKKAK